MSKLNFLFIIINLQKLNMFGYIFIQIESNIKRH